MNLADYQQIFAQIPYGKRLPNALYVYREDASDFGPDLNKLLAQLVAVYAIGPEFNLIKFRSDELKVSFLSYPAFFEDPHPALRKSIAIDLVKGKARQMDYESNSNPPILHRKETFLPRHGRERGAVTNAVETRMKLPADTIVAREKVAHHRPLNHPDKLPHHNHLLPLLRVNFDWLILRIQR